MIVVDFHWFWLIFVLFGVECRRWKLKIEGENWKSKRWKLKIGRKPRKIIENQVCRIGCSLMFTWLSSTFIDVRWLSFGVRWFSSIFHDVRRFSLDFQFSPLRFSIFGRFSADFRSMFGRCSVDAHWFSICHPFDFQLLSFNFQDPPSQFSPFYVS